MRIANFALAVFFLVLASLQVNNPSSPFIWILIYGAMAVVCLLAVFEFTIRILLILLILLLSAYAFWVYDENMVQHEQSFSLRFNNITIVLGCIALLLFYLIRSFFRR